MFFDRLIAGSSASALIASPFVYLWLDKLVGAALAIAGLLIGLGWLSKKVRPKPLFQLKVEREGRLVIIITLAIGFAALNTGSNLLYLILGMLLSLIVASGVLSQFVLSKLTVSRQFPGTIQAKVPCLGTTELTNRKHWMPSFNLTIRLSESDIGFGETCFVSCVDAGDRGRVYSQFTFGRRGRHDLSGLTGVVLTRFPFGLFTKSRRFKPTGSVLVYPGPTSNSVHNLFVWGGQTHTQTSKQHSDEIDGLKVFAQGDDMRRVNWKRSTIGEQLIVRDAPPTNGKTQHVWLCRSLPTVPFDPLEEAWISYLYEMIRGAQAVDEAVVIHFGTEIFNSTQGQQGHERIAQKLALLDTKTLPTNYPFKESDHLVIDISRPPMLENGAS
jgi:uncharacterized protein (DUF58 family)